MEKTFYKNLVVKENKDKWVASFKFSEECNGFFMPISFEGDSEEDAIDKALNFLGKDAEPCQ